MEGISGGMPQMDQIQQMMSSAQAPQQQEMPQEAPAQFNIQDRFTPSGSGE